MHPYFCSALITDCRSKVRDLVLVKRIHPQPSTALVPRIFTESVRFGCKEDGTFYLKIVPWPKFKNEIQFSHFHGSERQSRPIHASCIEEGFHAAQVFRLAGAIALPASILHDVPLSCPQPPQEDPLERHDSPSVRKCNNLHVGERPTTNPKHQVGNSMDTPISSDTPEAHQTLANGIERLPPFSTSKAWYREKFFSPILNLPTLVRSEQCASRERERSQVINDVDRLCAALDTTTLEEQNLNGMPIDSSFKKKSCGSSNHASGSRGSRNLVGVGGQWSAGSSGEPEPNRKRSSESGDESSAPKRTKDSDPKFNDMFQCRIYQKSNTPRDGGPSTNSVYAYRTCDGKPFRGYCRMVEHLLRVHIRPCQCGRCMSRFGRPSERNRHEDKVCKAKGLVKRTKKDPNDVPDYVVSMGEKISGCQNVDSLDSVLYCNDQKQYDFLDQTDVQKKTVSNPALEGAPKDLVPPPLSTTTHTHSLERVEGGMSNIGPFPASGLDEGHNRFYGDHMDHLDHIFLGGSQSNGLDGGPSGLDLENDRELANDLVPDTTNSFELYTDTAKEIEKIITNSVDAETDPERYKKLINILFTNLPKPLSEALVEHAHRCPENTHIAPSVLSRSQFEGPYVFNANNAYAQQIASEGDEIPVPLKSRPDSGYPASSLTTPDLTDTDIGDLQIVKEWCDGHDSD
ncbi:hypothetical protein DFP73DRAFT_159323 [Morchella snyderi]|nr:hypothetical protein DFP73DRAFT_159323 [Morchella snyderi]